jgi:hypothetical protein
VPPVTRTFIFNAFDCSALIGERRKLADCAERLYSRRQLSRRQYVPSKSSEPVKAAEVLQANSRPRLRNIRARDVASIPPTAGCKIVNPDVRLGNSQKDGVASIHPERWLFVRLMQHAFDRNERVSAPRQADRTGVILSFAPQFYVDCTQPNDEALDATIDQLAI